MEELKLTKADMATLITNSDLSPAGKRKALNKLGIETEYQPHQGKREAARRLSKNQRSAIEFNGRTGR